MNEHFMFVIILLNFFACLIKHISFFSFEASGEFLEELEGGSFVQK